MPFSSQMVQRRALAETELNGIRWERESMRR